MYYIIVLTNGDHSLTSSTPCPLTSDESDIRKNENFKHNNVYVIMDNFIISTLYLLERNPNIFFRLITIEQLYPFPVPDR